MIRLVAIQVALFLLPFAVWAIVAKLRGSDGDLLEVEARAPLAKLAAVGFTLTIIAFLVLAVFDGGSKTGTYVPDRFENGRIVPGHID